MHFFPEDSVALAEAEELAEALAAELDLLLVCSSFSPTHGFSEDEPDDELDEVTEDELDEEPDDELDEDPEDELDEEPDDELDEEPEDEEPEELAEELLLPVEFFALFDDFSDEELELLSEDDELEPLDEDEAVEFLLLSLSFFVTFFKVFCIFLIVFFIFFIWYSVAISESDFVLNSLTVLLVDDFLNDSDFFIAVLIVVIKPSTNKINIANDFFI